jgi:hypothetical protein
MFGDRTGKKAARKLKTWRYLWCFLLCPSLCPSQGDKDKNTVVPWRQRVNWQWKIPVRIKPPANHASFFHCPVRQVLSDVFWMYSLTFLSHFWMYSPMFFLRFAINVGEIIVPPIVASLMFASPGAMQFRREAPALSEPGHPHRGMCVATDAADRGSYGYWVAAAGSWYQPLMFKMNQPLVNSM